VSDGTLNCRGYFVTLNRPCDPGCYVLSFASHAEDEYGVACFWSAQEVIRALPALLDFADGGPPGAFLDACPCSFQRRPRAEGGAD
jgi:hypothetical protein